MATVTSVPGTLDITPDPLQKQSKVQIRRNNKKGRIEIVTSTDSGNNYKTLLPEVTSKVQSGSIPVVQESGDVEWSVLAAKASTLTGVVSYVNGGTGYGSYAAGDILYANQQGVLSKLPIGSADQLLTVSNALPVWQDATDTLINKTIESAILTGNTTLSSTSTFTPAAGATLDLSAANVILPTSTLSGFGYKAPVRAATTVNITLSNTQTVDNVALAAGDRVLVKNQSTASQNGIYIVKASASWTRSVDLDAWSEVPGAVVAVQEGDLNKDTVWLSTANASGGTIGSTNMPWGMIGVDQTGYGLTTQVLVGGGDNIKPVWTVATGTGAPVRAGSPTFTGNITFGGNILPSLDNAYDIGQSAEPRIRDIYCVGTAYLQNIKCAQNVFATNYQDLNNEIAFFKIGQDSTHSFFFTNRPASAAKVVLSIGTENETQTADLFHCYQNSVLKFAVSTAGTITTGTWNATVIAGAYGGTGVNNTGKTITLGGNLTTTGNFTTELITTAATSVTLPTSGMLVNTAVTTLSSLTSVGTITTGTWSGSFGAVSGASLTNLTAGSLTGTIPSGVLGNSSVYIGTTSVALNRTSSSLNLTGINIDGSAATVTGAGQPSITSVGTLTSLSVNGAITINGNSVITAAQPSTSFPGSITLSGGANSGANGGSINTSGFNNSSGGRAGGSINTSAANGSAGGSINTFGNNGGAGGNIDTSNNGGYMNTAGNGNRGGFINTAGNGGTVSLPSSTGGGYIYTAGNGGGNGGNINTSGSNFSSTTRAGGDINTSAGSNGVGGSINTTNGGGLIETRGNNANTGGYIKTSGWNSGGSGNNGGFIDTSANSIYRGGFIATSGNITSIPATSGNGGGYIFTAGNNGGNGGNINTSGSNNGSAARAGGEINTSATGGNNGGSINTSGNTGNAGGNINTSGGGGSITTNGANGNIELGVAASRTTLIGSGTTCSITLPNATGTLVTSYTVPIARAAGNLIAGTNSIAWTESTAIQTTTMSASATIGSITGSPSNGAKLELWVKGNASAAYTLKCALLPGTDSLIDMVTTGKLITISKTWILKFTYIVSGTSAWRLTSMIGGF